MTRQQNPGQDLACEIGDQIEKILGAGWSLRIGTAEDVAHAGAIKDSDDCTVDVVGEDNMQNLHQALATLIERIKV